MLYSHCAQDTMHTQVQPVKELHVEVNNSVIQPHTLYVARFLNILSTNHFSDPHIFLYSSRHHLSYDDYVEDKRGDYQNCSVLYRV